MSIELMAMNGALKSLLSKLPAIALRWYYTPERLERLIYCDIHPRGRRVQIDLGEITRGEICFQIINFSPFSMEIDRASFKLYFHGATIEFNHLQRTKIDPGVVDSLFLTTSIPDGAANSIARSADPESNGWITGIIEFNTSISNFKKPINTLGEVYPRLINQNFRKK